MERGYYLGLCDACVCILNPLNPLINGMVGCGAAWRGSLCNPACCRHPNSHQTSNDAARPHPPCYTIQKDASKNGNTPSVLLHSGCRADDDLSASPSLSLRPAGLEITEEPDDDVPIRCIYLKGPKATRIQAVARGRRARLEKPSVVVSSVVALDTEKADNVKEADDTVLHSLDGSDDRKLTVRRTMCLSY